MAIKNLKKIEEVLEKDVVATGTGAHINMSKKYLGKQVLVSILKEDHLCQECGKPVYSRYNPLCSPCIHNLTLKAFLTGRSLLIQRVKNDLIDLSSNSEKRKNAEETLTKILNKKYDYGDGEVVKELGLNLEFEKKYLEELRNFLEKYKLKSEDDNNL